MKINTSNRGGAVNGARTRDPQLGKLVLYQLSHIGKEHIKQNALY